MAMNSIKATFKGIPGEKVESIEMFDITFAKGKAVKVPYPSHAARKLANHPFFDVEGETATDADIKMDMKALTAAATVLREEQKAAVQRGDVLASTEAQVAADIKAGAKGLTNGSNAQKPGNTDPAKAGGSGIAGSTEFG